MAEIAEGGAAGMEACLKHFNQCLAKTLQLAEPQDAAWGLRANPRYEEALIGVNIADPGHQGLIQEGRFDGSAGVGQTFLEILC